MQLADITIPEIPKEPEAQEHNTLVPASTDDAGRKNQRQHHTETRALVWQQGVASCVFSWEMKIRDGRITDRDR